MEEELFRPRRPVKPDDAAMPNPMERAEALRQAAGEDDDEENQQMNPVGEDKPIPREHDGGRFQVKGNMPPQFARMLKAAKGEDTSPKTGFGKMGKSAAEKPAKKKVDAPMGAANSGQLKGLLEGLKGSTALYEEIQLPSKGKFYDGENGPSDGVISLRPMTGEEEQILATPRFVKKGQAVNMIFQKCLREDYRPESFLTVDRTYLLIYLRGISYSPDYDVEIKCHECEKKFATTLDLNSLYVETCPDDYGPALTDVMPNSKYRFTYRLSTGKDEQEIQDYRDRRIKMFGDSSTDDTLTHRMAQLLVEIEGLSDKRELQTLIKNLPINDVAYIRGCINEPPFGVETGIPIVCPSCLHEFEIDLPLEANFFFPRRKKGRTQA